MRLIAIAVIAAGFTLAGCNNAPSFDWSPYPAGTEQRLTAEVSSKDCAALRQESFTNLEGSKTYGADAFSKLGAWLDQQYKATC